MKNKIGENLNICIVTTWFPNKKRVIFAPFIYLFAKSLVKFGVKVSFIVPLVGEEEPVTSKDSITVYRVEGKRNGKFFLFSWMRLVNQIKPDVIHVQAPDSFSIPAIIVAKLKNIPIIATVHRGDIVVPGKLNHLVRKLVYPRFKKIIAVSEFSKSLVLNAGADVNKVMVIYNSCDETIFSRKDKFVARNKQNLHMDKKIILFVGNLIKRKGVDTLIESIRIVHKRFPDLLVLIVGHGEEREKLELLTNTYGLIHNVRFLGAVQEDAMADFYNSADAFVLPSISEGHSVALLEAMASGLPIIASDIDANKESVENGVNGFLFETLNIKDLAEKLTSLLTDDTLREKMSVNSYEIYLKKFTTEVQIQNFLKVYRSLLNRPG